MERRHAFTLMEVVTVLVIASIIVNLVFVLYVKADRATGLAMRGLEVALAAEKTLGHVRRTIRRARAVLPSHGPYRSGRDAVILRTAEGDIVILTRHDRDLIEIHAAESGGIVQRHPLHAAEILFDYGGAPPADARQVAATFVIEPVWHDTRDRMVLRTRACLRTDGRAAP